MEECVCRQYIQILQQELVPALGCTEPIAIAFAAAKAREVLGKMPQRIVASCSGNIIKNVKGVIVPTTGDMKGIDVSAVLGAVGGDSSLGLETLTPITPAHLATCRELLSQNICQVKLLEGVSNLQIILEVYADSDSALVEVCYAHTNIVRIEKNGQVLLDVRDQQSGSGHEGADYSTLDLPDIFAFATTGDISELQPTIDRQVQYNRAIAQEGLKNNYGASVGKTLLEVYGDRVENLARAWPAAGSDARMGGCVLPVVTNSGSGNQGMTVCLPVLAYAEHLHCDREKTTRALVLANLIAAYQKRGLGKLSAYCGAVSAACSAGAAITWLCGGSYQDVCTTITNTLANVSGIVCDGAKGSCAAKIASAVDAALLAHHMTQKGRTFGAGEGLVMDSADRTVDAVTRMGREGMRSTDVEILNIMIGK
ncbi:serine dehydratase subunit alpha family protein [Neobittarella massiliensis]|nr:L-serine ammonia-lyase, iron-sulfur-dependent, subunit alpha [Neobittarella massiliensis]